MFGAQRHSPFTSGAKHFKDWTMDLFKSEGSATKSHQVAAARAVGIILPAWMFDRLIVRRCNLDLLCLASKWSQKLETQYAPHA
jgi:hypothetical protein